MTAMRINLTILYMQMIPLSFCYSYLDQIKYFNFNKTEMEQKYIWLSTLVLIFNLYISHRKPEKGDNTQNKWTTTFDYDFPQSFTKRDI